MLLYLLRHADAVDVGEQGVTCDADRMLSEKGRKQAKAVAQALKALGCRPERIVSSPLVRARETADITAKALGRRGEVETSDHLCPGADLKAAVGWLKKQPDNSIMLVGHMPDLAELGSYLLAEDVGVDIALKKAGVLHVSFEKRAESGAGCVEWLLQFDMVKALGRE